MKNNWKSLLKAVFEMIADENTVMIKAAHVGQLLLLKKEKVWQRERIIITQSIALHHVSLSTLDFSVFVI